MAQRSCYSRRIPSGILLIALCASASVLFGRAARADGPHPKRNDQYKHQVEKLEQAWRSAELNDDVDAMDRLLSDDYVGITLTGQVVTKPQQLDRMKNRSMVLTTIELTDVKVKLIADHFDRQERPTTAIVLGLADVDGTNDGEPMHGTYRYTRVYSRLPSGSWKVTNFEATRVGPPPMPGGKRPRTGEPEPDQPPSSN
jgi:ketosteroid isomerase-like protein